MVTSPCDEIFSFFLSFIYLVSWLFKNKKKIPEVSHHSCTWVSNYLKKCKNSDQRRALIGKRNLGENDGIVVPLIACPNLNKFTSVMSIVPFALCI